jgi:hypothetical protein
MYLVLNPLDNSETTGEKGFGIWAELMRDMILGLIASLMTAIQLAMATTDAEVRNPHPILTSSSPHPHPILTQSHPHLILTSSLPQVATRLKGLKQWLELKKIPKSQQARTMEFFNELWAQQPVDPEGLFDQMPPNMRLTISTFLYLLRSMYMS